MSMRDFWGDVPRVIHRRLPPAVVVLMGLCAVLSARGDDNEQVFTDPAKAGKDFQIQGEYLGEGAPDGEKTKLGAQVVALGEGKFRLVGFIGGLPGAGWKRGDSMAGADGKMVHGLAEFVHDDREWIARIEDGVLTAVLPGQDEPFAVLKKIERKSPTLGAQPPQGALVLFDGSSADLFVGGKLVDEQWLLADCESQEKFGDHSLHLEFRTPFKPAARGQARGNSGVYLQSRYEMQVLDSFGLSGENNECGGIYSIQRPAVNMCLPPLSWQTYDYDFTAAKYNEQGEKIANARVTVKHNGVVIHDDLELTHGTPGRKAEGPSEEPLYLQGHGNPVVYRNIWAVKR